MTLDDKKTTAQHWFRSLRDDICARFEKLEQEYETSPRSAEAARAACGGVSEAKGGKPPSFEITSWNRPEGGGGEIGMMKGRVFEKVGVNISTVMGEFSPQFRNEIPGAKDDPRFWASGISLVAHMRSPLVPAAHFNTRMITVGEGTRLWFGGGGDLNPMFPNNHDTADFHGAFQQVCDAHDAFSSPREGGGREGATPATTMQGNASSPHLTSPLTGGGTPAPSVSFYEAFSAWCEEYFFIPHRNETRGVGGIFYDYLGLNRLGAHTDPIAPGQFGKGGVGKERTMRGMEVAANASMDWDQAFGFTQQVGRAFADIYPTIIARHMFEPWTPEQREHQLRKRGRYAEYNLLYDRGTRFGLMTGGNPEAILMSLPPEAKWD